ncbi:SGNH/GDSL hydrolase family protein [Agromyces salentinus]|uniref:SGNH hydrolase-type esterase domain-containing protein n=1 Tax=Agromyces salentinus TaxID=269421 RepID=A0ABP4YSM0_9MICO|nr:SGNH/GDSL hydrolase family protein [Agromyces salentinus]
MDSPRAVRRGSAARWWALAAVGTALCVAIVVTPVALGSTTPASGGPVGAIAATTTPRPTPSVPSTPSTGRDGTDASPRLADLPVRPRALFLGDSFTEGYGASRPAAIWATIAAGSLRWQPTVDGIGGTGFTKTTATDGTDGLGFRQRLLARGSTGALYDVVVLQGGLNDWQATGDEEYAAVARAVRTARTLWPEAVVVVFGPAEPIADGTKRLAHLPLIRDAALDSGAVFIDPSSPSPWITAGNSDLLDLGDGLHLNDSGYAYLAARFVAAVLAQAG